MDHASLVTAYIIDIISIHITLCIFGSLLLTEAPWKLWIYACPMGSLLTIVIAWSIMGLHLAIGTPGMTVIMSGMTFLTVLMILQLTPRFREKCLLHYTGHVSSDKEDDITNEEVDLPFSVLISFFKDWVNPLCAIAFILVLKWCTCYFCHPSDSTHGIRMFCLENMNIVWSLLLMVATFRLALLSTRQGAIWISSTTSNTNTDSDNE